MHSRPTVDERVKAALYLKAILPLMADLSLADPPSRAAAQGRRRIIQLEVTNGPAAHLTISGGTINHGIGRHPSTSIRLVFKTPALLNRMFAGENIRPSLRKGFLHLPFLLKQFPVLADRLTYFLEGEGRQATDGKTLNLRVTLGLHAMLAGMATVASDDPSLKNIAAATPEGTLLVKVLPDGPFGSFSKKINKNGMEFASTFGQPVPSPNAIMEFADRNAAKRLIDGELNAVTAIGLSREIKIRGLLPLIEKASIFLYRFGKLMAV